MSTPSPRTWFITGASSGFGTAFAEFALARGDNVVATARSVGKLEALVATMEAARPGTRGCYALKSG